MEQTEQSNETPPKSGQAEAGIFVTGGTGFIGSHFLKVALTEGPRIVALRRTPDSRPRIPIFSGDESQSVFGPGEDRAKIEWLNRSLTDVVEADFAGCDVVVHLAAHSANTPYDTLENCIIGNVLEPLRLFRTAAAAGVRRFVVAGSCFEYGRAGERYEFIPPDAPLEPTQTYPSSKAAATVAFYQLAVELGLELSIHRIFQVFGEGEASSRLWPSLRRAARAGEDFAMTAAEQVRDFTPVEEVARQLLAACAQEVPAGKPLISNLGTGTGESLRDFASKWWRHWGGRGELKFGVHDYRPGEVMRFVPKLGAESRTH